MPIPKVEMRVRPLSAPILHGLALAPINTPYDPVHIQESPTLEASHLFIVATDQNGKEYVMGAKPSEENLISSA